LMRRSKRKRHHEILVQKTSSPNIRDGSISGIVVTRAVKTEVIPVRLGTLESVT
jgi:hypothetical protein